MKAMESAVALLLAAAILSGCATHHKMGAPVTSIARSGLINDPRQASELEKAMMDEGVSKLLDLDVRAKLPTKLAVAKLSTCYDGIARLDQMGAEELKQWEMIIPDAKLVTGVHYISGLMVQKGAAEGGFALREIRMAAARMRCELLLVYVSDQDHVNNYNDFAALYWTFVGMWLIPGNVLEHRAVMQAVILDCRTGAILGTAIGDAHLTAAAPLALMEIAEDRIRNDAPKKALAELQAACKGVLADIVARAVSASKGGEAP